MNRVKCTLYICDQFVIVYWTNWWELHYSKYEQ